MCENKQIKKGDEFVIPNNGMTEDNVIKMIAKAYNANLCDFFCINNKIIYSPVNIGFIPKEHNVIFIWDKKNRKFDYKLRPNEGFSEKYLTQYTFIPKKEKELSLNFENNEENTDKSSENSSLHKAKREKNDEFYTRYEDVVNELRHYKEYFKGKIVYCPCDKAYINGRSSFAQYFIAQFHQLGIKKLICTQYNPNGKGTVEEIDFEGHGLMWDYNGEEEDSDKIDETKINLTMLEGDGSFYSKECIDIMSNCDIVITNPPFSLFRKFIEQIVNLKKKFLIIGNMNAITYKEVFRLIMNNEIWLGYNTPHHFEVPFEKVIDEKKQYEENGKIYQQFGNICWYTNLEHNKRKELLYICKKYDNETYPTYDNYKAIEVSEVKDIPCDYNGIMGVPVSFLQKYNPLQFEIIGTTDRGGDGLIEYMKNKNWNGKWDSAFVNGSKVYKRLFIKRKLN